MKKKHLSTYDMTLKSYICKKPNIEFQSNKNEVYNSTVIQYVNFFKDNGILLNKS